MLKEEFSNLKREKEGEGEGEGERKPEAKPLLSCHHPSLRLFHTAYFCLSLKVKAS